MSCELLAVALFHQWMADYRPQCTTDQQTVLRAAHADWLLRLEEQQYGEVESSLRRQYGPLTAWNDAPHQRLQLFRRRLDHARHNFRRCQRAVERFRPARRQPPSAKADETPKRTYQHTPCPMTQYMEAFTENGVTRTVYNPPTPNLLRVFDKFNQPDKIVQRILRVRRPFPPEYDWFTAPEDKQGDRVLVWECTVQQCRPDLLRDLAEGNGHVLPSPHMELTPPNPM